MSFLARFRVLTKILAVVGLLGAVSIGIAGFGIVSLKSLSDATDRMELIGAQATMAQRLAVNLMVLTRAEYKLAADPRPENRKEVNQIVEAERERFLERLQWLKDKAQRPKVKSQLARVEAEWQAYTKELAGTLSAANEVTRVELSPELDRLRKEAELSAVVANRLRAELRSMADDLDKDVATTSAEATAEYHSTSKILMLTAAFGIILGVVLGFMIGQYGIAKPLRSIVVLLQQLAAGNYSCEIDATDRKDEVGDVAKTALVFRENGLAKERMEQEHREAEAMTAAKRRQEMMSLADQFESAVGEIVQTVSSTSSELEASASTLTSTANHSQVLATTVAAASEEASTNVQSVASATEQLSSSVDEIGRQVQQSAHIANEAVEQARSTTVRVSELSRAADRIGDVVELINTIAGQTNLLALNATIEAARAGDAGRGFAVVASEVKALAEQTAKATGDIAQQIGGIQSATQESVSSINEISATIKRLSEISSTIAAAVEEQGAATQEISRNVQQAAQGTQQVSSNVADVQRGASETGAASTQVLSAAQTLSTDSSRLKIEVNRFLSSVRAA